MASSRAALPAVCRFVPLAATSRLNRRREDRQAPPAFRRSRAFCRPSFHPGSLTSGRRFDYKRDAHFPNVLCYRILRFVTQIDVEYCCIWPVPFEEFQCATRCRGSRQRGRIQVHSHKLFKSLAELARSSQVVALWLTGDAWRKRSNALGISHCRFSIATPAIL